MRLLRRLAYLLRWRRAERELAEELAFHREQVQQSLEQMGVDRAGVATGASRRVGNATLAREDARAVWIAPWLEGLAQDVRHGIRSLRRSPGLVVVASLSLGLGIGLNTMLGQAVVTIYRHQPTMADPESMIGIEPGNANQFSYPDYRELRQSGIVLDALGFRSTSANLRMPDVVTPVGLLAVTANFFDVLGVRAQVGRTFSAAEAAAELEPRLLVVTNRFWRNWLNGKEDAIGRSLTLNGQPFTIVGVLPESYRPVTGWAGPALYVPLTQLILPTLNERGSPLVSVLARRTPGSSIAQVQAAVTVLGAALERAYPERNAGMGQPAKVYTAESLQFRGMPAPLLLVGGLLWGSVLLVLVIGCVNVMGLLMARAAYRRREIAIRVAVGAGRGRVIQAMLVESLLLVLAGLAVGVPLAYAFARSDWVVWDMLRDAMTPDQRIIPFVVTLVVAATLVCGLVPALRATRRDVVTEVRQGGNGATVRLWLRHALVVGQVAMSVTLIVLALLCVRSQVEAARVDLGFDIDHGVVAQFSFDPTQYPGGERLRFADRVVDALKQIPGVTSVSVANLIPLGGDALARNFHPAGLTDIPGSRPNTYSVGPAYFRTLSIPVIRGREFDERDVAGSPMVAVVNETFVRTHFPGQDVIGRRVQTGREPEAEIVGVVRDSRIDTIGENPQSVVYFAFDQRPRQLVVHARTSSDPQALVPAVARTIEEIDGAVPVSVQTLRRAATPELTMRGVATYLAGSIGAVGLLLALIGLYGVMAYVVASRTAEIGIRMTLGATARRIGWEVLSSALGLVAAGLVIGGAASFGLAPALRTFLVGVSPYDGVAFAAAAVLLACSGVVASLVPAFRASRVDPMVALKQQ
jgi:putative ABC transport system permease protein